MKRTDIAHKQRVLAKCPTPSLISTVRVWQEATVLSTAPGGQVKVQTDNGFIWWVKSRYVIIVPM